MRVLVLLVLSAVAVAAAPKSLPASWKRCSRSDPKINECLRDAIADAIVDISKKGVKDLGVFPIDPLRLTNVNIDQGTGPVSIDLRFMDLDIIGLKGIIVNSLEVNISRVNYIAKISLPSGLTLKGRYRINGKVLVLPIQGVGEVELNLEKPNAVVDLRGKTIMKEGLKYATIDDFIFNFNTTRLRLRFDNLFNGNRELSAQMNTFLNENWMEILNELKPSIQDAFGTAFREITNRIFHKVPYDKTFLDD